jgi:TolB-like protein
MNITLRLGLSTRPTISIPASIPWCEFSLGGCAEDSPNTISMRAVTIPSESPCRGRGYRPRFEANENVIPVSAPDGEPAAATGMSDTVGDSLTLAVLPFANLTGDPQQSLFCQGLTEELISALSVLDHVDVISRTSAFQFEGQSVDVRQVGRELHVEMVLEGSVRRENDETRVTAQLTEVADGFVAWSSSFDRKVDAGIHLQEEIAGAIVESLQPKFAEVV